VEYIYIYIYCRRIQVFLASSGCYGIDIYIYVVGEFTYSISTVYLNWYALLQDMHEFTCNIYIYIYIYPTTARTCKI